MNLRTQVLSALKWTLIGRLSSQIVSWAITIVVMRLLAPNDYGLVAMTTIFSGLFAFIAEIGLGYSLVQSKEVSTRQTRQVFAVVLTSNFCVSALLAFGVAPLASWFFAEPRIEAVMQVISLQFIPAAFAVIPNATLDRAMRYRERAFIDFSSHFLGALLILFLAREGYGALSLVWGTVFQTTFRAIGLNCISPYFQLPLFRFSGSGQIIRFGRDVAATQFIFYIYSQADSFVIGKLLGGHDLGLYSVSMNLASMPASRFSAILNQVAFPAMSKVKRDGGNVNQYLLKSLRGISLLSFPVMWGMSCVSTELVAGLLGGQWLEATDSLALLCLIMPLRVLSPIINAGLQSVGRADVSFRNTVSTAIVMCAAFVVGCQAGLPGMALAWISAFPLVFLANVALSRRHLDLTLSAVILALLKPLLASLLMYGAVWGMREGLASLAVPPALHALTLLPLPRLGILVFTGALAYLLGNLLFNRTGLAEVMGLLRPARLETSS